MVNALNNRTPTDEPEPRDGRRQWFCVQTKARCEDFATLNLENKAITVFSPKIEEFTVRSFKNVKRVVPLFPTYIFAKLDPIFEHDKVRWTPGVKQILSSSHGPIRVEDEIIAGIVAALEKKTYLKGEKLKTGDAVAVKRGAFSGVSGIFQRYAAGQARVKVLLDLLYQQVVVEFDRASVRKI